VVIGHDLFVTIDVSGKSAEDGVEKILAVFDCLKAHDRTSEKTLDEFPFPRTRRESGRTRKWDMPEHHERGVREPRTDHFRRERQMIVLNKNDWGIGRHLLAQSRHPLCVGKRIHVKVMVAEYRTN
jgi:hypothetical protein